MAKWCMLIDNSVPVRAGESIDAERLRSYLAEHLPNASGLVEIEQFPGGYSNLTYLVRAGDREMVLRRPPVGASVKGGHDMLREYRILSRLIDVYGKVPRPLVYCDDPSVLGAPFYVMERVRGVIIRGRVSTDESLDATTMRAI